MIFKIVQCGKKWLVKRKSVFPFIWKICTVSIETGAGYKEFPRWFETSQDALTWVKNNISIEILVCREKSIRSKERIFLRASSDKKEHQYL